METTADLSDFIIEGPYSDTHKDISYSLMQKNPEVMKIEKGIPIKDFISKLDHRNMKMEFSILTKVTCTEAHFKLSKDKHDKEVDRYSDILPFERN